MKQEKFKVSTQLLSYTRKADQKAIPYIMVDGLICRTQGRITPDTDGNIIGEVTVEKITKGTPMSNGQPAPSDSWNLVDFTPRSLTIKSKEYDYREAELGFKTTVLNRKSAEAATLTGADLFATVA